MRRPPAALLDSRTVMKELACFERLSCLVALLLAPGLPVAASPSVPTLPPGALHAGQRAVVHTVFAGDSVETFEAEIVGVLPGGRAEGDLILARALGPRVEATGVAQGMSGSPVYVDGKLIGALSSGWAFSKEPVFGITPIGEMLAVLDQPESPATPETPGPVGVDPTPVSRARFREFRWADADTTPLEPAPAASERASSHPWLALPLSVSGANPAAMSTIRALFEPEGFAVVPGGRDPAVRPASERASGPAAVPATGTRPPRRPREPAAPRAPNAEQPGAAHAPTLGPGDAVAVDVLRGDLNFSAIGTVTYRDGDRVLIFGHPFFQSGEVRLPLSTARIATILGNVNTSFKLGIAGTPVGTATQDRRAAVAGRLGAPPPLMPIRVVVRGAGPREQRFAFESIDDRSLLPQLLTAAVLNSLLESGGSGLMQTIRWSLTLWQGGRSLRLADVAAGESPVAEVAATLPPLPRGQHRGRARDAARPGAVHAPLGRARRDERASGRRRARARPARALARSVAHRGARRACARGAAGRALSPGAGWWGRGRPLHGEPAARPLPRRLARRCVGAARDVAPLRRALRRALGARARGHRGWG